MVRGGGVAGGLTVDALFSRLIIFRKDTRFMWEFILSRYFATGYEMDECVDVLFRQLRRRFR
jgi:hypothetical protein